MNFSNDNLVEALDFDVNLKICSTDLLYSKIFIANISPVLVRLNALRTIFVMFVMIDEVLEGWLGLHCLQETQSVARRILSGGGGGYHSLRITDWTCH